MASWVPKSGDGLVVELGAGTGVVTQALLQRGITSRRLIVIERSPVLVQHLRNRFPDVTVLHGDAAKVGMLLPRRHRIDAIVSSLPLRSLPQAVAAAIVAQWVALVPEGGIVVQFTYDLRSVEPKPLPGFLQRAGEIVWANLPPARVLALERRADAPSPGKHAVNPRRGLR